MPYKDKNKQREHMREYMRRWRAKKRQERQLMEQQLKDFDRRISKLETVAFGKKRRRKK